MLQVFDYKSNFELNFININLELASFCFENRRSNLSNKPFLLCEKAMFLKCYLILLNV